MYRDNSVHVILPAYNEEGFIAECICSLPEYVDRIVVVDDCSVDRTREAVAALSDPRLLILQTHLNSGVGGAMKLGYQTALENGAQILVKMDADGQMPPEHLSKLLDGIVEKDYDYAKGNRFLHSKEIRAMPASRIFGNIILTFLTKAASGYWHIFDPQNGYTAIRASALRAIPFERIDNRFFFENDILVHLNIENHRVIDIAMPARYGEEISDLKISKILLTFPPLLLRRFAYRVIQKYVLRNFSPIALFLLLGLPLFFWGLLDGAYLWAHSMATGAPAATGSIMLALVPIVLGFQLILQAIVLDIQETPK